MRTRIGDLIIWELLQERQFSGGLNSAGDYTSHGQHRVPARKHRMTTQKIERNVEEERDTRLGEMVVTEMILLVQVEVEEEA